MAERRRWLAMTAGVAALALVGTACLAPGEVDGAFTSPDLASLCPSMSPADLEVEAQPDGSTLLVCEAPDPSDGSLQRIRVVELAADGALGTGFGGDGLADLPHAGVVVGGTAAVRAPDGDVLVLGSVDASTRLYRLDPDGSLDTGFIGPATRVSPATIGYVAVDGSSVHHLLQAGAVTFLTSQANPSCSGCGTFDGLRVRAYDGTGKIADVTVGLEAFVDPVPVGATDVRVVLEPVDVAFDGDLRYLIGGTAYTRYTLDGVNGVTGRDVAAVRLVAPGVLDATYGSGGLARLDVGFDGVGEPGLGDGQEVSAAGMAVSGGQVWFLASDGPDEVHLGRIGTDGTLDTTLGGDGFVALGLDPGSIPPAMDVDLWDRAVVSGRADGGAPVLRRLLADGTPDPAYGTGGTAELPEPSTVVTMDVDAPRGWALVVRLRQGLVVDLLHIGG